jgi:hypothetical protein
MFWVRRVITRRNLISSIRRIVVVALHSTGYSRFAPFSCDHFITPRISSIHTEMTISRLAAHPYIALGQARLTSRVDTFSYNFFFNPTSYAKVVVVLL